MTLKISSILRSGILAQAMLLADPPAVQAQAPPENIIRHPEISALPPKNTPKITEADRMLLALLLGGTTLTTGSLLVWGYKLIKDSIKNGQSSLDEVIKWRERDALKNKLSNNDELIRIIQEILKQRGGIDSQIYK